MGLCARHSCCTLPCALPTATSLHAAARGAQAGSRFCEPCEPVCVCAHAFTGHACVAAARRQRVGTSAPHRPTAPSCSHLTDASWCMHRFPPPCKSQPRVRLLPPARRVVENVPISAKAAHWCSRCLCNFCCFPPARQLSARVLDS